MNVCDRIQQILAKGPTTVSVLGKKLALEDDVLEYHLRQMEEEQRVLYLIGARTRKYGMKPTYGWEWLVVGVDA